MPHFLYPSLYIIRMIEPSTRRQQGHVTRKEKKCELQTKFLIGIPEELGHPGIHISGCKANVKLILNINKM